MAKKFTEKQREIMARRLGYDGPMNMFDQFVKSDPAMERKYNTVVQKLMARGGMVNGKLKMQTGGAVPGQLNYETLVELSKKSQSKWTPQDFALLGIPASQQNTANALRLKADIGGLVRALEKAQGGSGSIGSLEITRKGIIRAQEKLTDNISKFGGNTAAVPTNLIQNSLNIVEQRKAGQSYTPIDTTPVAPKAPLPAPEVKSEAPVLDYTVPQIVVAPPTPTPTTTPTTTPTPAPTPTGSPMPSWVTPPPPGALTTQALVTLTNPITGEKWVAPSGGYTVNVQQPTTTPPPAPAPAPAPAPTATPTTAPAPATQPVIPPTQPAAPQVTAEQITEQPGQMLTTEGAPTQAATAQPALVSGTAQVAPPPAREAETVEAATATPAVAGELQGLQAATGTVSEQAQVQAATMEPTETAVSQLQAAQGVAGQVEGAPTRELVAGELVEGPAVNRAQVEEALAKNEAAQGVVTEDMTIQGQLAKLTANFEADNPPSWAAGALRNATAALAQRGLGASSLAGQALIQATIEAALPIAAADAQVYRDMGIQNLSNRQQMAVLTAQQRAAFLGQEFDQAFQTRVVNAATISEIANLNFSAKQQIALENARLTETMNLANLNNRQALVLAEAAQIASLEMANLNNRQQANVLNAQAFLQMDLANLSNEQQTRLFKSQSMIQSILSDVAAENAARQFNASSQNQVNQFYDGLTVQVKQFNAAQTNAMNQFNAEQFNSVNMFNASQQNARDQFNAEFRKIIDQSNAEWRRNIALQNTAAINRANEFNATAALGLTTIEYNNLWQGFRDQIEYAWKTGENALDRENELARQVLAKQATIEAAKFQLEAEKYKALGSLAASVFDKSGLSMDVGNVLRDVGGLVKGAASGTINAIKNIFNTSQYVEISNSALPGDPAYGWTYYGDGSNNVTISPSGQYYYNNELVWSPDMPPNPDPYIYDMQP